VVRLLLVLSISSLFYSFTNVKEQPYVVILGIAKDGGAPHAALKQVKSLVSYYIFDKK